MSRLLTIITYMIAFLLIFSGGAIYLCYRPMYLRIFEWAHLSASTQWLVSMRSASPDSIPSWVIYALPDGLWACSYTLLIGAIWHFSFPKCLPIAIIIPVIGIVSELFQWVGMVPGVFDFIDLVAYIAGGTMGVIYIYFINRLINI